MVFHGMPILYVDSGDAYGRGWLVARRTLTPRGGGEVNLNRHHRSSSNTASRI
ncbi:hypothetical protein C8Q75DRAFT_744099 [Abortiporus biennis]|nr:hypothetical protein C8Q75DRAFT_744099 [Abortiporus biennis]